MRDPRQRADRGVSVRCPPGQKTGQLAPGWTIHLGIPNLPALDQTLQLELIFGFASTLTNLYPLASMVVPNFAGWLPGPRQKSDKRKRGGAPKPCAVYLSRP